MQSWLTAIRDGNTSGAQFDLALGFNGVLNPANGRSNGGTNDFFQTVLNGFGGVGTAAQATASLLNSLSTGPSFGENFGALSVLLNNTPFLYNPTILGQDLNLHQFTLSSASEIGANNTANFTNFALINDGTNAGVRDGNDAGTSDNATFTFAPVSAPVPEPSSLTLLTLGAGALCVRLLRRRK
jgi:hypothetical protein